MFKEIKNLKNKEDKIIQNDKFQTEQKRYCRDEIITVKSLNIPYIC